MARRSGNSRLLTGLRDRADLLPRAPYFCALPLFVYAFMGTMVGLNSLVPTTACLAFLFLRLALQAWLISLSGFFLARP